MEEVDSQEIMQRFGKNLKKIRNHKGFSVRDLAHAADIDPSSVTQIEAGTRNPMLTMIVKLAYALKIDPCDLMEPFS